MDVLFERPRFRKLKRQGLTYVDMHYHTNHSMDTSTRVGFIAKRAKMLGCGVAITDHNAIGGVLGLIKKKTMVVPSIEITTSELIDIIPYFYNVNELKEFYNKYIKNYVRPNIGFNFNRVTWRFTEMIDLLRKYNCLIFIPHPFASYPQSTEQFLFKDNKNLLKKITGFEVLNGLMKKERNERALEITKEYKKAYIGGSDGHTLLQLGQVITVTENTDLEGFLDYIKHKQNIVIGEELVWSARKLVHLIIMKNCFKLRIKNKTWQ